MNSLYSDILSRVAIRPATDRWK